MPLLINLRDLDDAQPLRLAGELPAADLELDQLDELIHFTRPVAYDLTVEKLEENLLVRGRVGWVLDCECSRCLQPFADEHEFPDWACHLPLQGEERVPVINDQVDLTSTLREDILLEFPQHPLCRPECGGLHKRPGGKQKVKPTPPDGGTIQADGKASAWDALDNLKF